MFTFPQLAILLATAVVMVDGQLKSMQEPLSLLVAEHYHEHLKNFYTLNQYFSSIPPLLSLWVTEIAFHKRDETRAIAIIQVITIRNNGCVQYFCVFLVNCKKGNDKGKKTFTFDLLKSKEWELHDSKKHAEEFAKNVGQTWTNSMTAKEPTNSKPTTPSHNKNEYKRLDRTTSKNQNGGLREEYIPPYVELRWDSNTGKPKVETSKPLKDSWTIKGAVDIPQNK